MNADQADLRGFWRIPAEGRKADQRSAIRVDPLNPRLSAFHLPAYNVR
jgi:hypothetical protein